MVGMFSLTRTFSRVVAVAQNNYHRNLPSTQYFATALAYYRAMYRSCVFVVATDEPKFAMRSVVNKFGDVYYTSECSCLNIPVTGHVCCTGVCSRLLQWCVFTSATTVSFHVYYSSPPPSPPK